MKVLFVWYAYAVFRLYIANNKSHPTATSFPMGRLHAYMHDII